MRILTTVAVAVVVLLAGPTGPVGAVGDSLAATATGSGAHSYVYGWTVSKTAARPTVQIASGVSSELSYTITATRTKVDDGYGVALRGCAGNTGANSAAGVSLELQLESAPSPSGPFVDVESGTAAFAVGALAAGAEACREVFFGVVAGTYSRNRVTVSSSGGGTATATSEVISLPAEATSTWDARASVEDVLGPCPAGFTCGPTSRVFPLVLPSPANDPGATAAPFSESVGYTQRVTGPVCGSASGTLRNTVTLTELDSGQNQGRSSSADVFVTTGSGTACPQPTTGDATDVLATTTTATGTVDTHGLATSAYFEYGPTEDYGSATAPIALSGTPAIAPVTASLSGLAPATTYHYRLATYIGTTRAYGADRTFTTARPQPPPPKRVTICFRQRTLHVTKAQLARYLRRGAVSGMCKKKRPRHAR